MSQHRIFITGGGGFIGSHVVDICLGRGYAVCVYDDFSTGRAAFLPASDALTVVEGDLLDEERLKTALTKFSPTHVVHMAAIHFIPYCNDHPSETIDVNIKGTELLLSVVKALALPALEHVLVTSSAAVYPPSSSLHRETDELGPTDIYGLTKYVNEMQAKIFHKKTGAPTTILRIFNAYGPRETNPHLVPEIFSQLQEGRTTFSLGNLTTKRSYVFVKDLARAIVGLMERPARGVEAFNIGSRAEYSADEIVAMLARVSGKQLVGTSTPDRQRPSDRPHLQPSLDKIEREIGWAEEYDIEKGLREILSADV